MREGGKILGSMLAILRAMAVEGLDCWELEKRFIELCAQHKVLPACKGYHPHGFTPFPTGLCFNINDEVVHNYPQKGVVLKKGDIVTIDTVIKHKNYYLDSAVSFGVGDISQENKAFLATVEHALTNAIAVVKPGIRIGDISHAIQDTAETGGYSVLREYAGHGIGRKMHEFPEIPCFGEKNTGPIVYEGMTLAIEPLICQKSSRIIHKAFWKTRTADGGNFAQFEHTVLVTAMGHEILTDTHE